METTKNTQSEEVNKTSEVTTTNFPADVAEETWPKTTNLPNGDVLTENQDGSKVLVQSNGVIIDTDTVGTEYTKQPNGNISFTLKDKLIEIKAGKGYDVENAQRHVNNGMKDDNAFMRALMCECVKINGAKLIPEDARELPASDYIIIFSKFQQINF